MAGKRNGSSTQRFRILWLGRPWRWGLWARGLFDIGPIRLDWRR